MYSRGDRPRANASHTQRQTWTGSTACRRETCLSAARVRASPLRRARARLASPPCLARTRRAPPPPYALQATAMSMCVCMHVRSCVPCAIMCAVCRARDETSVCALPPHGIDCVRTLRYMTCMQPPFSRFPHDALSHCLRSQFDARKKSRTGRSDTHTQHPHIITTSARPGRAAAPPPVHPSSFA